MAEPANNGTIAFGGGCFWCVEAVFSRLKGVVSAIPGFAGGLTINPTYEKVCGGSTGHAEVVRVEYDPKVVELNDLLEVFFAIHDPTTENRQGSDIGTQYRSVIFYTTGEQRDKIENFIENFAKKDYPRIVTEVRPLDLFYPAEDYHREYYKNNSGGPYCQVVINPKLDKLKSKFQSLLKP